MTGKSTKRKGKREMQITGVNNRPHFPAAQPALRAPFGLSVEGPPGEFRSVWGILLRFEPGKLRSCAKVRGGLSGCD